MVDCEKMPAAERYTSLSRVTKLENLALVSSEKYNLDTTQGLNETRKHLAQMQMAQPADDPKRDSRVFVRTDQALILQLLMRSWQHSSHHKAMGGHNTTLTLK